jgi:hypothetical protein
MDADFRNPKQAKAEYAKLQSSWLFCQRYLRDLSLRHSILSR